ncbi:DUF3347 domain-containing protein [Elizabethkingia meningoseptica]|uniref:DUF3347 domain-containing protein n=1 Tax=Elizabethkingia meningoseptica TaxID=238 RepID=UPI0038915FC0
MKYSIIIAFILVVTACSKPVNKESGSSAAQTSTESKSTFNNVYNAYFQLKDALAKDDGNAAQSAGKELEKAINNLEKSNMNAAQSKTWQQYQKKLAFDAEHIGSIDENKHQREHFVSLSKNLYEVMKTFTPDKTVYYQNCPMYNHGKGANWLSLEEKINNPYYGKEMPDCGKTIETLK